MGIANASFILAPGFRSSPVTKTAWCAAFSIPSPVDYPRMPRWMLPWLRKRVTSVAFNTGVITRQSDECPHQSFLLSSRDFPSRELSPRLHVARRWAWLGRFDYDPLINAKGPRTRGVLWSWMQQFDRKLQNRCRQWPPHTAGSLTEGSPRLLLGVAKQSLQRAAVVSTTGGLETCSQNSTPLSCRAYVLWASKANTVSGMLELDMKSLFICRSLV